MRGRPGEICCRELQAVFPPPPQKRNLLSTQSSPLPPEKNASVMVRINMMGIALTYIRPRGETHGAILVDFDGDKSAISTSCAPNSRTAIQQGDNGNDPDKKAGARDLLLRHNSAKFKTIFPESRRHFLPCC